MVSCLHGARGQSYSGCWIMYSDDQMGPFVPGDTGKAWYNEGALCWRAGAVEGDMEGMRDHEFSLEKDDDVFRILTAIQ